jgi:hypothetical protein
MRSPQEEISFNVEQPRYPIALRESPPDYASHGARDINNTKAETEPADALFDSVRTLMLRLLTEPRTSAYVASALNVNKRQAETWLSRLLADGLLEKRSKPARYVTRDVDLFKPIDQL